jgi:hypothetical protein
LPLLTRLALAVEDAEYDRVHGNRIAARILHRCKKRSDLFTRAILSDYRRAAVRLLTQRNGLPFFLITAVKRD